MLIVTVLPSFVAMFFGSLLVLVSASKCTIRAAEIGYIQPGHGCRGKQRWIVTEEDVEEMYRDHYGKVKILLWCYMSNKKEAEDADRATCQAPRKRLDL